MKEMRKGPVCVTLWHNTFSIQLRASVTRAQRIYVLKCFNVPDKALLSAHSGLSIQQCENMVTQCNCWLHCSPSTPHLSMEILQYKMSQI